MTAAAPTTMHGKERVIAPVLMEGLGLDVDMAMCVNIERLGTSSRDIERAGPQLDAARAKIAAGFEHAPWPVSVWPARAALGRIR